jgi:peroxiredoxin
MDIQTLRKILVVVFLISLYIGLAQVHTSYVKETNPDSSKKRLKTELLEKSGQIHIGEKAPLIAGFGLREQVVSLKRILRKHGCRAVLVSFFASWCRPCLKGIMMLQENQEKLRSRGIDILLVNVGEDKKRVKFFIENHSLTLPVMLDEFMEMSRKYLGNCYCASIFRKKINFSGNTFLSRVYV